MIKFSPPRLFGFQLAHTWTIDYKKKLSFIFLKTGILYFIDLNPSLNQLTQWVDR